MVETGLDQPAISPTYPQVTAIGYSPPGLAFLMSNYINSHVADLSDLDDLSDHIKQLKQEKERITAMAQSKVNTAEVPNPVDPIHAGEVSEKIVIAARDAVSKADLDEALADLGALTSEYGNLQVIQRLKDLVDAKKQNNVATQLLENAASIEYELSADSTIEELAAYAKRIEALDNGSDLSLRVTESLNGSLQHIIDEKRKEMEPVLIKFNEESGWYTNIPDKSPESYYDFPEYMSQMIALQAIMNKPAYPESWWALDIILKPFSTKFNYHYNGNKETNNISKPEWALSAVATFLGQQAMLIDLQFAEVVFPDGKFLLFEIITGLLKPLRSKILSMERTLHKAMTAEISPVDNDNYAKLLTHLIYEVAAFDQTIRIKYQYNPHTDYKEVPKKKWAGLIGDILQGQDADGSSVNIWLGVEKQLATKAFQSEVIDSPKADEFYYLYSDDGTDMQESSLTPTHSSYALVKLMDNLTSHFQTLGIVKHQLKFVSSVQLDLIDRYCEHLKGMLNKSSEVYGQNKNLGLLPNVMSTGNQPGSNINAREVALATIKELKKIYCSAKFVRNALEKWSFDLIFVQLWNAYKSAGGKWDNDDSSLFDSALKEYSKLIGTTLSKVEVFFKKEIKANLKDYVNTSKWDIRETHDSEISSKLNALQDFLRSYMSFWSENISNDEYRIVSDKVVSLVSDILYEYIITNHQFTKAGIKSFAADVNSIVVESHDLLYFESQDRADNCHNPDYLRLKQSINFLTEVDLESAKNYKRSYDHVQLRKNLDMDLSALSNSDLSDLLLRIL